MPTIIDVAKKAKVSPSTVSRYIHNKEIVSKKKASTIENAISELGYVPNLGASFLKSQKNNLIGLVLPSFSNSFFAHFIEELSKELKKYGKQLLVFYASDQDDAKQQIKTLLSFRAGTILFTLEKKSHTLVNLSNRNDSYFLQVFSDNFPEFDSVIINDKLGTEIATENLVNLGHKKILLIDRNNNVFYKRLQGYISVLKENNIEYDESYVLALENNINVFEEIKNKIINLKPTAIISVTEDLSQQTCLVLQELKLEIPKDISLICYDDSYWAKLSSYSVIRQPMDDVINNIINLINKSHNKSITDKISIAPVYINRNSTRGN